MVETKTPPVGETPVHLDQTAEPAAASGSGPALAEEELFLQDIRIAAVMSGGVSLAIWMGGASLELYRLTRCRDESDRLSRLYASLLDTTKTKVTIDVLSGTSAGGVNGVLLAAAIMVDAKVRAFESVRDTWLSLGSFNELLQPPSERQSLSLLRGDSLFLPEIDRALRQIVPKELLDKTPKLTEGSLDLYVTTTLLSGSPLRYTDDYGEDLSQINYRGRFEFSWGAGRSHTDNTTWRDLIPRLALAARSSASFPGAFEASFIPVGSAKCDRPDMAGFASFSKSRYVIDGGVLDNQPIGLALDALTHRRAFREVRRLMTFLRPHPSEIDEAKPDKQKRPPSLGQVLQDALLKIPASQSLASDLDRIDMKRTESLRQQRHRRILGKELENDPVKRTELAGRLRLMYCNLHAGTSTEHVMRHAEGIEIKANDPARLKAYIELLIEGFRANMLVEGTEQIPGQRSRDGAGIHAGRSWGPFVKDPGQLWKTDATPEEAVDQAYAKFADEEAGGASESAGIGIEEVTVGGEHAALFTVVSGEVWPWLTYAVGYAASLSLSLVRRGMSVMRVPDERTAKSTKSEMTIARRQLSSARAVINAVRQQLRLVSELDTIYWRHRFEVLFEKDFSTLPTEAEATTRIRRWLQVSYNNWPDVPDSVFDDPAELEHYEELARALRSPRHEPHRSVEAMLQLLEKNVNIAAATVLTIRDSLYKIAEDEDWTGMASPGDLEGLRSDLAAILSDRPDGEAPTLDDVVDRLVETFMLQSVFGLDESSELPVELLQISGDAVSEIDLVPRRAEDKLAGVQLAHFGAFLKRSWRANDWMWGRLDAATRISAAIFDPRRLLRVHPDAHAATAALERVVTNAGGDGEREDFEKIWKKHRKYVKKELVDLYAARAAEYATKDDEEAPGSLIETIPATDTDADYHRKSAAKLTASIRTADTDARFLPCSAAVLTETIQTLILQEELPRVADAVELSTKGERGYESMRAAEFRHAVDRELAESENGRLPADSVGELLALCRIGEERWSQESGNDLLTDTASRAAVSATNAIRSPRSGLGPLRGVVDREGSAVTFGHILAQAATRRTRSLFAVLALTLVVSLALVTVAVFGGDEVDPPGLLLAPAIAVIVVWVLITFTHYSGRAALLLYLLMGVVIGLALLDPVALDNQLVAERDTTLRAIQIVLVAVAVFALIVFLDQIATRRRYGGRLNPVSLAFWVLVAVGAVFLLILGQIGSALDATDEFATDFQVQHEFLYENRVALLVVILPSIFMLTAVLRTHAPARPGGRVVAWASRHLSGWRGGLLGGLLVVLLFALAVEIEPLWVFLALGAVVGAVVGQMIREIRKTRRKNAKAAISASP